jgi:hypothetical protein
VDLDYILGKALRAEPDGRYASVDAFANDVRAYLDAGRSRPVPADRWYRGAGFCGVTGTHGRRCRDGGRPDNWAVTGEP